MAQPKNASVSYVREVPPEALGHVLTNGSVPKGYAAHLTFPHISSSMRVSWLSGRAFRTRFETPSTP